MIEWYGTAYAGMSPMRSFLVAFKRLPFFTTGAEYASQLDTPAIGEWWNLENSRIP